MPLLFTTKECEGGIFFFKFSKDALMIARFDHIKSYEGAEAGLALWPVL